MSWVGGPLGLALIAFVLWDAFETILLPRRVPSVFRLSRLVLRGLWIAWSGVARHVTKRNRRENLLSLYPLLSLIGLLAVWAAGLVLGFALLHWAAGTQLASTGDTSGFEKDLYMSGTTLFTLGLGDVAPMSRAARLITVIEAGTGFGFLALVLAYVPVLYLSFSSRESRITLLDSWAGSPPAAAVILRRAFESRDPDAALASLFRDWEMVGAQVLESHLSYPLLAFFRSQHDNQSWLAALAAVLDACALVIAGVERVDPFQARLTFAMGRHTLVDLAQSFRLRPAAEGSNIEPMNIAEVRRWLKAAGVITDQSDAAAKKLAELRQLYVPYVDALSRFLLMPIPSWLPPEKARFNWQTTAWARTARDDAH